MSASQFVGKCCKLVGRPFKPEEHQPAAQRQLHLGLLNLLDRFRQKEIALEANDGKLEELKETCREIKSRQPRLASLRNIMQLAGRLVFLTTHVFHKMAMVTTAFLCMAGRQHLARRKIGQIFPDNCNPSSWA